MKQHERHANMLVRAAEGCLALLLTLVVVSCSGGVPSESDAKDVFAGKYRDLIDQGLVRIDSFAKVNAQDREMFGAKIHTIEYRATISWPKGLNTQCIGINNIITFQKLGCTIGGETRTVGQVEEVRGNIAFEKTEKGWKGQSGKLY